MFPARWMTAAAVVAAVVVVAATGRGGGAARDVKLGLAEPYVFEGGQRCDVDTMCLTTNLVEDLQGTDALGEFFERRIHYLTLSGTEVIFSVRDYGNGVLVFKQDFPYGLQGTSTGDKNAVSTCFPCLTLPDPSEAPDLRYVTPGGYMAGWTLYSQGSIAKDLDWFRDGEDGGLVVLFSGEVGNVSSIVISSLTNPMSTNVMLNRDALTLEWGVKGLAEYIPAGYSAEVILYPGSKGIGRNVMAWGEALRTYHATQKEEDPSAEVLSYYTDNGAAHYYNPLPYSNFHEAMMSVYNYSVTNDLPIKRLQLDSWWYHKGAGGGVKNWTEIKAFLPEGIAGLYEATGWPVVAHNRYFSSDTDYAEQNGGPYLFTVDEENEKALPLEKVFWDDLFDSTVTWGMETYEQDWLDRQYMLTSALQTNLTLGSKWLNDMGEAALERDLNIQYCMSFVRHLLHSVTLPAVTQIRVSDDYMLNPNQWRIGATSLLAHALALRPFKDVFWTSYENVNVIFVDCDVVLPDPQHPLLEVIHQYGGSINVTASGKTCVPWRDFGWDDLYFGDGMYENFCRNPDDLRDGPFCYTNASFDLPEEEWEWEYCDVPRCQLDCYILNGIFYLGQHNVTQSGLVCEDWNGEYDLNGAKCRNPDNDVAPWCYTNADHTERDYCDNKCPEGKENNPNLQAAVSTLAAGPFGVGDRAVNLNIDLIRKSCSADGLLLHASKPLTVVDGYFFSSDYREVWTAYSDVSSTHFGIIFLAEVEYELTMTPEDLNLESAFVNQTMVFSNYPELLNYRVITSPQETLDLPSCGGYLYFCLLYTTPRIQTEEGDLYILGELDKWVPVSPNRITEIRVVPSSSSPSVASSVLLSVRGVQSEAVTLSFTGAVDFTITCDFLQDGVMTADTQTQSCNP